MSEKAAKEISQMLTDGISKVERIIKANSKKIQSSIEVNKSKIAEGVESANLCNRAFANNKRNQ